MMKGILWKGLKMHEKTKIKILESLKKKKGSRK